ncbi:MAG: septum formation inhibitor Maf [Gemmatimonadaceae bacterium]|nr:septum formation inhibitor Maf [Gemmatimonadaceae bacterium]
MSRGVRVILASQSPRRRDLLDLIGIPHEVRPADLDERLQPGESPPAHAERLAREKALALAAIAPDAVVIGADTIVVLDGAILGKPASEEEAAATVRQLAGRTHTVFTAVAVTRGGAIVSGVESVEVTFRPLTDDQIRAYVATGEPMDKAGAYGIQGYGAVIVERIHGDYFAVMGLAIGRLVGLLADVGVSYRFGEGLVARES